MTDKELKDWCKTCNVEPPAMRFKCPECEHNPDKEQVIIDGKGCRYKTWDAECSLTGDHYGDNMKPCKFIDEKSCYFKQLARKTQECEELKKTVLTKCPNCNSEYLTSKGIELYEENKKLKKECEELKKQLKTSEKWRINAESLNEKLDINNTRYRKALEEIEEVINNIFDRCLGHKTDGCTPVHNVCEELIKILDIINKTKGEV